MHIPADWHETTERILGRASERPPTVMVVGAPDVGKSTFCAYLASRLHQAGLATAVADADIGQSSIGPPAAISGGLLSGPIASLAEVPDAVGYFVGAISPVGHLLACTVGTARVVQRLRALGAKAVVVDTSGLVHGSAGRALKEYKADLLQPTDTVVLQRREELAHLVRGWERSASRVHLLNASPAAVARLPGQRRSYRAQRFAAYFATAQPISLSLDRVYLRNTWLHGGKALAPDRLQALSEHVQMPVLYGEQHGEQTLAVVEGWPTASQRRTTLDGAPLTLWSSHRFSRLLCGLLDDQGFLVSMAILHHVDFTAGKLRLLAPPADLSRVRTVYLGRLLLQPNGTELAVLQPGDL
ncbi:MAG: Clp1/GlmU family protein [Caldilineales bacterium]|nr:Clp1/GlmU family protein [Caldilineales bacterium]MDW8319498.1 Clp1/GlmU family protein [Anaerolineae bacterium]